ncbi:MAG: hypothetical protein JNL19_15600 [Burkholderiales bacterium]|nr:hypothetical protein [Burkholderiales bacterium]
MDAAEWTRKLGAGADGGAHAKYYGFFVLTTILWSFKTIFLTSRLCQKSAAIDRWTVVNGKKLIADNRSVCVPDLRALRRVARLSAFERERDEG